MLDWTNISKNLDEVFLDIEVMNKSNLESISLEKFLKRRINGKTIYSLLFYSCNLPYFFSAPVATIHFSMKSCDFDSTTQLNITYYLSKKEKGKQNYIYDEYISLDETAFQVLNEGRFDEHSPKSFHIFLQENKKSNLIQL